VGGKHPGKSGTESPKQLILEGQNEKLKKKKNQHMGGMPEGRGPHGPGGGQPVVTVEHSNAAQMKGSGAELEGTARGTDEKRPNKNHIVPQETGGLNLGDPRGKRLQSKNGQSPKVGEQ